MASEEVNVIALVENLELAVPRRLPVRLLPGLPRQQLQQQEEARVVELDDRESEVARFSLGLGLQSTLDSKSTEPSKPAESPKLLQKLPPVTVPLAQLEPKAPEKKLITEAVPKKPIRSRTKKSLEVRRNPLRTVALRKEPSKESHRVTTSRQRLLAARRRCVIPPTSDDPTNPSASPSSLGKRSRSASGYMSTRSVTRKQVNVGATYEAPTWRDQAEWKLWPAHGMHERPVYHPQFGLAAEYNGRVFASFDGESYREISNNSETQIEIVRVDPRAESFDSRDEELSAPTSSTRYVRRQNVASAVVRQKLTIAQSHLDKVRTAAAAAPSVLGYGGRAFDRFHTLSQSLGLVHRQPNHQQQQHSQLEPIRNLERLQQLESLQRLGSRMRLQKLPGESYPTKYLPSTSGRLLSKDVLRSLQQQQQQTGALGLAHQTGLPSSSRCLIVPRSPAPVNLPFCEVQAVKSNSKGKLFFVKAPDTLKKAEKTSTITSSTQSSSVSWAEVSLRKRPDGTSTLLVDVPRTFASNLTSEKPRQPRQLQGRGYPPIRLAETTSIFRAKVAVPREDPALATIKASSGLEDFRSRACDDGHQAEVLDLSKKELPRLEERMAVDALMEEGKVQSHPTDLVQYFKNFGADESVDLIEEPKNSS